MDSRPKRTKASALRAARGAVACAGAVALACAVGLGTACSGGGDPGDEGSPSPSRSADPSAAVRSAARHLLSRDTAPEGLELQRARRGEPTPGAEEGWEGGWTTESLVLPPGRQRRGWEWVRSTVNVYADAAAAARAYDLTRAYVVSTYAGRSTEADAGIGDESIVVRATRNAPDVTVLWRRAGVVMQLEAFGGPPLTNGDIVSLARRLNDGSATGA